ncbi:hypothetical protein ACQKEM_00835 [Pseudomonas sp. NPDC077382]
MNSSVCVRAGAILLAALCGLFYVGPDFWSGSADYAHHYALVARLYDLWGMPSSVDDSLGEMNYYPRYAHVLGASLGVIVKSPFLGMHLLGLVSFIFLWISLGLLLARHANEDIPGVALFAAVGMVLAGYFRLEVFGYEIIGNYFYPQLVGQSILFAALFAHVWFGAANKSPVYGYLFLAVVAAALPGVHLLPALELLAVTATYILLDYFFVRRTSRIDLIMGGFIFFCAFFALVMNPSFSAMKSIAENNGDLFLRYSNSVSSLAIIASSVMVLSLALLFPYVVGGSKRNLDGTYVFAVFGLAVSGLFGLQMVALMFGVGSEYAIKKYAFGINSSMLLLASVGSGRVFSFFIRNARHWVAWRADFGKIVGSVLPLIALYGAVNTVMPPNERSISVKRIANAEDAARDFYSIELSGGGSGNNAMVFNIDGLRRIDSYMLSLGALRHPRNGVPLKVLADGAPPDINSDVAFLITSSRSGFRTSSCVAERLKSGLVAIDLKCAYDEAATCPAVSDFSYSGNTLFASLYGFGEQEQFGRWTTGNTAGLSCTIPYDGISAIEVAFGGSFSAAGSSQKVGIFVNGVALKALEVRSEPQRVSIDVAGLNLATGKKLKIEFSTPGAVSPKDLGVSIDERKLGVIVRSVSLISDDKPIQL